MKHLSERSEPVGVGPELQGDAGAVLSGLLWARWLENAVIGSPDVDWIKTWRGGTPARCILPGRRLESDLLAPVQPTRVLHRSEPEWPNASALISDSLNRDVATISRRLSIPHRKRHSRPIRES